MLYLLQLQQQQRQHSNSTTDDQFNNTHQQQQEREEDEEEEQRLLSGLNEVALSFHKDLKLLRSITNFYHAAKEKVLLSLFLSIQIQVATPQYIPH